MPDVEAVDLPQVEPTRRSVARRVLLSFLMMLGAFAFTAAFAGIALRQASEEAEDLGKGLLPVALQVAELRSLQETLATIIDGLPDERNPVAARHVVTTLVSERTLLVQNLRTKLDQLANERPRTAALARSLRDELDEVDEVLDDGLLLRALFDALTSGDRDAINRSILDLGTLEHTGKRRLRSLSDRMTDRIGQRATVARQREQRSFMGLLSITLGVLLLGAFLSVRTRRMLAPLAALNARARAVAAGDLSSRAVVAAPDELGELQTRFENMVQAIARARERTVDQERFAAIGKMAAHVTHEVRNPLSSIGLNLELLEEELADGANESRALLTAIRSEVDRLERLSEQYLRLARLPSPRLEADNVAATISAVLQFEKKEMDAAGCKVNLKVESPAPAALFDESQLRQALLNLLRNAREAMPTGGEIDIEVATSGLAAVVTVADRGPGIPEEVRSRIFDPFFSTKGEGTGLGLAITKQIIDAHGGTLTCEARQGGGTAFRVTLPITPPVSSTSTPPAP
jgi:signal transduction histidine kinase